VQANECGHAWQARLLGSACCPVGAGVMLFREDRFWWDHVENLGSSAASSTAPSTRGGWPA